MRSLLVKKIVTHVRTYRGGLFNANVRHGLCPEENMLKSSVDYFFIAPVLDAVFVFSIEGS